MGKLKNVKAAGLNEVTGEVVKRGSYMVLDWSWRLCNMAFESGVLPEDRRSALLVPLYKGKGESTGCMNYRGISLLMLYIDSGVRHHVPLALQCIYGFSDRGGENVDGKDGMGTSGGGGGESRDYLASCMQIT